MKLIDKSNRTHSLLRETVVTYIDKKSICILYLPEESHPEGGLCAFRAKYCEVSTCGVISTALKKLNTPDPPAESDVSIYIA